MSLEVDESNHGISPGFVVVLLEQIVRNNGINISTEKQFVYIFVYIICIDLLT